MEVQTFRTRNIFFLIAFVIPLLCAGQTKNIVLLDKNEKWSKTGIFFWPSYSTRGVNHRELGSKMVDRIGQKIVIPSDKPLFFNFVRDSKFQFVCLFPGDTLEYRATKGGPLLNDFTGTRPKSELMFYSLLQTSGLGPAVGNHELTISSKLNFDYIADRTQGWYRARMDSLNAVSSRNKFSSDGYTAILQSLYYNYLESLLFPYSPFKPFKEVAETSSLVPNSYKAKLKEFENELSKDSLMHLLYYRRFLLHYGRFQAIEHMGDAADWNSLLEYYMRMPRGEQRNLLLFDEIVWEYGRTKNLVPLNAIIDSISNQPMRDTLMSMQRKAKGQLSQYALQSSLETPEGAKVSLQEIVSGSPGSVVYVDFWATWCGPCLKEMPASRALTEEFKGRQVEFVYLSVDENVDQWKKKLATLPGGTNVRHFRFIDSTGPRMDMGISAVPVYFMIGKSSNVVSANAPRPGSDEIRPLIESLIKK